MQSEGFLQTMKTVSFSGLCRSQRLVLSYQGTPHAELCDALRYQDISSAENLRKLPNTISVLLLVELVALVWPGIKAFARSIALVPCQCSVVISRMNRRGRRD